MLSALVVSYVRTNFNFQTSMYKAFQWGLLKIELSREDNRLMNRLTKISLFFQWIMTINNVVREGNLSKNTKELNLNQPRKVSIDSLLQYNTAFPTVKPLSKEVSFEKHLACTTFSYSHIFIVPLEPLKWRLPCF